MEGPGEGDDLPVTNTTRSESKMCALSCPFNVIPEDDLDFEAEIEASQPCYYRVRITETFKGKYSVSY